MFRFTARASPQAAFAQGARGVNYMGHYLSRRHCNQTHSPMVAGYINTLRLAGSAVPASAFAMLWSMERSAMATLASGEETVAGVLARMIASSSARIAAMPVSDCAATLSRTLMSNAMCLQWTLCCKMFAMLRFLG